MRFHNCGCASPDPNPHWIAEPKWKCRNLHGGAPISDRNHVCKASTVYSHDCNVLLCVAHQRPGYPPKWYPALQSTALARSALPPAQQTHYLTRCLSPIHQTEVCFQQTEVCVELLPLPHLFLVVCFKYTPEVVSSSSIEPVHFCCCWWPFIACPTCFRILATGRSVQSR